MSDHERDVSAKSQFASSDIASRRPQSVGTIGMGAMDRILRSQVRILPGALSAAQRRTQGPVRGAFHPAPGGRSIR